MGWILDNAPRADNGFTYKGIQYPPYWIRDAGEEARTAIGITKAPDPKPYDQRFSWGWDETETHAIWKDITYLKPVWKEQQEIMAKNTLNLSDWRVIKAQETGVALSSEWKDYRAAVRLACNNRQAEIEKIKTAEALQKLITEYPTIPDTTKEVKDSDGKSYVPKQYETKANPESLEGIYPWPKEPDESGD